MDDIVMGRRDARRLGVVQAAMEGKLTSREGAEALGLSVRQFKRLRARVRQGGATSVVHGNRGRPSTQRLSAALARAGGGDADLGRPVSASEARAWSPFGSPFSFPSWLLVTTLDHRRESPNSCGPWGARRYGGEPDGLGNRCELRGRGARR